jgi:outer membrane lipoprotein LolB
MNMLKPFGFLSLVILTACAPPKIPSSFENLPQTTQNQSNAEIGANLQTTNGTLSSGKNQPLNAANQKTPSSWELSGAMAARNKNKAWSASVNWLQRGAGSYQIRLFGPFGSGSVLIEKQGGTVVFHDGPKSATSKNADELLMQQTGVRLPVNNLYYWVRALPAPGSVQSAKRDQANRLIELHQAGFTITYLGYSNVGSTLLPTAIKLQGNGVFIKLIIKRWKI